MRTLTDSGESLAVDMLTRGASPYGVAKMLRDAIEMVEWHYTPFVRELRQRVRAILRVRSWMRNRIAERPRVKFSVTPVPQPRGTIQRCDRKQIKKHEQACKPSFVPRLNRGGDHSSSPDIAIGIKRPTRES
jgi:hypothetical protein